jgi:hypothetical protein
MRFEVMTALLVQMGKLSLVAEHYNAEWRVTIGGTGL